MSPWIVSTLVFAYCHSILLFFQVSSELNHTAATLYWRDTHNTSWAVKSTRNKLPCYGLYSEFLSVAMHCLLALMQTTMFSYLSIQTMRLLDSLNSNSVKFLLYKTSLYYAVFSSMVCRPGWPYACIDAPATGSPL